MLFALRQFFLILITLLMVTFSVSAKPTSNNAISSSWFVGLGATHLAKFNSSVDQQEMNVSTPAIAQNKLETNGLGFTLFVGKHVTPHFSAVLGMSYVNGPDTKITVVQGGSGSQTYKQRQYMLNTKAYYSLPVSRIISFIGLAGIGYYDYKATGSNFTNAYGFPPQTTVGFQYLYGGGLSFKIHKYHLQFEYIKPSDVPTYLALTLARDI